ncbi:MAG: hypothetical protein FWF59_02405, partial [Turicibacter sp.]|nr:hypothetical protein [Turicibacter sp.]
EMQAAAYEAGNAYLVVIAALILAFQSFPGFILTPVMLKKAMRADLQNGGASGKNQALALETKEKFPEAYQTTAILLAITAAIGILSFATAQLTREVLGAFAISQAVWGLLYGILFSGLGWIPKGVLDKAMSSGIILILVIFSAFGVLATTTFTEIAEVAAPVLGLLALGIAGIFIFCILAAKILKLDWRLAVALGLNCLLGFPLNYQLTKESIRAITNDPEEAKYLEDKYMPMMLVAGFVTITIGSVFLAGFLRNFV